MKSNYWENRKADLMYQQVEKAEYTSRKISKIYAKSSEYISNNTKKVFSKFKKEYGLSDKEARKIVKAMRSYNSSKELKRVLMNQNINEDTKRIIDEITSSGYAFRLNYFDELQNEVDSIVRDIYKSEKKISTSLYKNILKDGFNKSMFEIQKNTGFTFGFEQPDAKEIKAILNAKWEGSNYSDRIWANTQRLADTVKEEIAVSLLTGRSQSETARLIDYKFGVGSFNARRLIRTETCYFENEAESMSYKEAGIEKYRFIATLDLRTSNICREHDNKVYKLKDKVIGENYPPLHPFCRSTTIAVFEDGWIKDKKRIARNKNDENIEIQNMSYKDWYDKYVNADENNHKVMTNQHKKMYTYNKNKNISNENANSNGNFIIERLQKEDIKYEKVWRYLIRPSEEKIISNLSGGDLTSGSCSSLAFAYAGNKNGLKVRDFRGGKSRDFFAQHNNIKEIANISGVKSFVEKEYSDFNAVLNLTQNMVKDKEYYLATGRHAAIVRKSEKGFEYLELQDEKSNGFKRLNNKVLRDRFKCKKSHTIKYIGKVKQESILIDIDSLKGNSEFKKILGYINTSKNKQIKGVGGSVK